MKGHALNLANLYPALHTINYQTFLFTMLQPDDLSLVGTHPELDDGKTAETAKYTVHRGEEITVTAECKRMLGWYDASSD